MIALLWAAAGACVAGAAVLVVRRGRRRETLLAVSGAGSFDRAARRTWLLWACLAGGLVVLLLAVVLRAARAEPAAASVIPPDTSGVIVIDLSSSTLDASKQIARALLGLVGQGRRLGLVVFSDTAYEALPPSAPAESLRDWLELLAHDPPRSYPWAPSFSGGTWISSGLIVARHVLRRDGVEDGHVLLVSDLVDGPSDLPNLQSVVAQYQREGIHLGVISVSTGAKPNSEALTSYLQQPNADFVERAATRTIDPAQLARTHADPTILLVLAALLGLLAAWYELALHPFTWKARA
jgi:hypothetical protein